MNCSMASGDCAFLRATVPLNVVSWAKDVLNPNYHEGRSLQDQRLKTGEILLYVQVPDGEDGEPNARFVRKDPEGVSEARRVLRPVA